MYDHVSSRFDRDIESALITHLEVDPDVRRVLLLARVRRVQLRHDLGVLHVGRLGEDARDYLERLGELSYGVLHTHMTPNWHVTFW